MRQYTARIAIGLLISLIGAGCGGDKATGPEAVATVRVQPATLSLRAGESQTLAASLVGAKGTAISGRAITWSIANSTVAQISSGGEVTAIAPGQTTVVATAEGRSGTMTLMVLPAAVATVSLDPQTIRLYPSQTTPVRATLKDSRGNTLSDRAVSWTSSNPAVAAVSGAGVVTAVALGTAAITATSEGKSATAAISVVAVPIATLEVSPSTVSLYPTNTRQLTATAKDSAGNALTGRPVSWTSSNPAVAAVSGAGVVTAVALGTAAITATSEGKSATAAISVVAVPIATLEVSPSTVSLYPTNTGQLTATAKDSAGNALTGRPVSWTSSNPAVATVATTGVVTAVAQGMATVTAASEGKRALVTVAVDLSIGQADAQRLARNLDRQSVNWFQPAADTANQIFLEASKYSTGQWHTFFSDYFSRSEISDALVFYLQHPVVHWSPYPRAFLQPIVFGALQERLKEDLSFVQNNALPDPRRRARVSGALGFVEVFGTSENSLVQPDVSRFRQELFRQYGSVARTPPTDTSAALAQLRRFLVLGTRGTAPTTPELRQQLTSSLLLSPVAQRVLSDFDLLLLPYFKAQSYGDRLSEIQERDIYDVLSVIDRGWLPRLISIGVEGTLNGWAPFSCCLYIGFGSARYIVIASDPTTTENTFPTDAVVRRTPIFRTILVHELHHEVDNALNRTDAWYSSRRAQLIAAAGNDQLNYLRSMVSAGYFPLRPAEFWSSLMQQWFVDSEATLRLGILRFASGRKAPLNQALFAVDVWVRGTGKAAFFVDQSNGVLSSAQGKVQRFDLPVKLDGAGNTVEFSFNGITYTFVRAANGDVLSVSESRQ